jgi:hypothetical protein
MFQGLGKADSSGGLELEQLTDEVLGFCREKLRVLGRELFHLIRNRSK